MELGDSRGRYSIATKETLGGGKKVMVVGGLALPLRPPTAMSSHATRARAQRKGSCGIARYDPAELLGPDQPSVQAPERMVPWLPDRGWDGCMQIAGRGHEEKRWVPKQQLASLATGSSRKWAPGCTKETTVEMRSRRQGWQLTGHGIAIP